MTLETFDRCRMAVDPRCNLGHSGEGAPAPYRSKVSNAVLSVVDLTFVPARLRVPQVGFSRIFGSLGLALLAGGSFRSSLLGQTSGRTVILPGVSDSTRLRWPSIGAGPNMVFVAGNVFRGKSLGTRVAYLGRLREDAAGRLVPLGPVDLPRGDFQFAYPRILATGGNLHLVWGEFDSPARTADAWASLSNRVTSLWHSVLTHGTWSTPSRITTAYWLGWTRDAGGVALDSTGSLHVVAWTGDTGVVPRVNEFRMTRGEWTTASFPYGSLNQATALVSRGDTVLIALVAEAHDTARAIIAESFDHGVHWTHGSVASQRATRFGTITRLALAPTADGVLLAVGEKANDSFYLDTIRVIRLKGTRVSSTQFIDPPAMVDGFELAGSPCGTAVMLLRTFSSTPQTLVLTFRRDSSPIVIRPLMPVARIAVFPGIGAGPRSVFAAFGYDTAAHTPWRNVITKLPVCLP